MDLDDGPRAGEVAGEVIGDARDGGAGERLAVWLHGRRRQVRVIAAVGTAAVVIAVAGVTWTGYLRGPDLPELVRARSTAPELDLVNVQWTPAADGRPASRPAIGVQGEVVLRGLPADPSARTELLGLVGPGLPATGAGLGTAAGSDAPAPLPVPGDGAAVQLIGLAPVDCDAVPLPVPGDRYGVKVAVSQGGRRSVGVLPAAGLGTWFAGAVQDACGSWLAKRDVTVTGLRLTLDARLPQAAVTLDVENRGRTPVRLSPLPHPDYRADLVGGEQVVVPQGTTAQVRAVLRMTDCLGTVVDPDPADSGPRTTSEGLALVGIAGPADPAADADTRIFGDGVGPTGLPVDAAAAAQVDAAKATLCGIQAIPIPTLGGTGREHWDAAHRVLTLPLVLGDVTGTVRGGRILATDKDDAITLLTPVGTPFALDGADLNLDLRYRLTGRDACDAQGHPQVPGLDVELQVATPTGLRTMPFRYAFDPSMPTYPGGACR